MKSISSKALAMCALFGCATSVYAIPTLQVGAPGVGAEGLYADYANRTSPTEDDTAITYGRTILVGGAYTSQGGELKELLIGGQYSGLVGTGLDWSGVNSGLSAFNGRGAVLMASVPDGAVMPNGTFSDPTAFLTITMNGVTISPFLRSKTSLFPNNHAPTGDGTSDFLFFDIGNFATTGTVPNFDEETGSAVGQIKSLLIATSGFQWIHFDVMALVTTPKSGGGTTTGLLTSLDNNPGSKDVTWKDLGGPPFGIPEPATPLLLGLGLVGLLLARRVRSK